MEKLKVADDGIRRRTYPEHSLPARLARRRKAMEEKKRIRTHIFTQSAVETFVLASLLAFATSGMRAFPNGSDVGLDDADSVKILDTISHPCGRFQQFEYQFLMSFDPILKDISLLSFKLFYP